MDAIGVGLVRRLHHRWHEPRQRLLPRPYRLDAGLLLVAGQLGLVFIRQVEFLQHGEVQGVEGRAREHGMDQKRGGDASLKGLRLHALAKMVAARVAVVGLTLGFTPEESDIGVEAVPALVDEVVGPVDQKQAVLVDQRPNHLVAPPPHIRPQRSRIEQLMLAERPRRHLVDHPAEFIGDMEPAQRAVPESPFKGLDVAILVRVNFPKPM